MSKKLLVINADQWMEIQFDQQITIGRDVFNALCLQDLEVSRSHAIIFEQESDTIIKDLRSRNGLFVNGERAAEALLKPGDEVILGSTVIVFQPSDTLDLGQALSKRGKFLLEKRAAPLPQKLDVPDTLFSLDELDQAIESLFSNPENTTFFNMSNALMLLQALKEMDAAHDATELFESALRRALTLVGGHRGVLMEVDEARQHLKVRSIISVDHSQTILIGQPILRALLSGEKGLFCANILRDKRFEQMAVKCKRPLHSFMAVPIKSQQELFGFIYIDSEDSSVSYDFTALRSLYFIAFHLGSLLRKRPMHFTKHAQAQSGLHAAQ